MKHLALGVLLLVLPARVHAESPALPATVAPLRRIAPAAREAHEERARELERAAEHLLHGQSGVLRAAAHVQLPDPAYVPLDQPLPPAKLLVSATLTAGAPAERELRGLLDALVAPYPEAELELLITRAPAAISAKPAQKPESSGPLRQLLALSLAANVLLATLLLARFKFRAVSVRGTQPRR